MQDNNRVKHKQFEITIHFLLRRRNGDDTTEAKQIEEEVLLKCWYVCISVNMVVEFHREAGKIQCTFAP